MNKLPINDTSETEKGSISPSIAKELKEPLNRSSDLEVPVESLNKSYVSSNQGNSVSNKSDIKAD